MTSYSGILTLEDRSEKTTATAGCSRIQRGNQDGFSVFRVFMGVLVGSTVALLIGLSQWGYSYYSTPFAERAFHPHHALLNASAVTRELPGEASRFWRFWR